MIRELFIHGFRGFATRQTVKFALPDGEHPGSGLSVIIGANNSGKTTIIEAIRAFNHYSDDYVCFSEGRRNNATGGRIELSLLTDEGEEFIIRTIDTGGAATTSNIDETSSGKTQYYVVPSRRTVPIYFYKNIMNRQDYIYNSIRLDQVRSSELQEFNARIFEINKRKLEFDPLISSILGADFEWEMELSDIGQYFIKYGNNGSPHTGDGVGDGIWSIFTICAALFDSEPNSTIVIDEPELSLHPSLQRSLERVLVEYAKDRQIILSTHSSYFVDWNAILSGGTLTRVCKKQGMSLCYDITDANRQFLEGLLKDIPNPHVLGNTAKEALFIDDKLILTEGQEDVVVYNQILKALGIDAGGEFFGWGVGGESKMKGFLDLFSQLGYQKVAAIYDGNKEREASIAEDEYPQFKICCIPTADVRDKPELKKDPKVGIATSKGVLKDEYKNDIQQIFEEIKEYFS